MKVAVVDPFDDEVVPMDQDLDPKTGRLRTRTKITVSILTSLVMVSYAISGAMRVFFKFVKTATRTNSIDTSFEAAVDEVILNEDKMMKLTKESEDDDDDA